MVCTHLVSVLSSRYLNVECIKLMSSYYVPKFPLPSACAKFMLDMSMVARIFSQSGGCPDLAEVAVHHCCWDGINMLTDLYSFTSSANIFTLLFNSLGNRLGKIHMPNISAWYRDCAENFGGIRHNMDSAKLGASGPQNSQCTRDSRRM